jgi:hypothetical protein
VARREKSSSEGVGLSGRTTQRVHVSNTGSAISCRRLLAHLFFPYKKDGGNLAQPYVPLPGNIVYVAFNKKLIKQGHYHYAYSHHAKHSLTLPDETFTITCLRDPVKRLISHYKMILEYSLKNPNSKKRSTEGMWLGASFGGFLENIPKLHLLRQLSMFSKSFDVDEAYDNIMNLSYYFFLEDFSSGVAELSRRLNIGLQPLHQNKTSTQTKVDISDQEMDQLRSMLEPEYLLINRLRNHAQLPVVSR